MKKISEFIKSASRLVRGYVVHALASKWIPGAKKSPVTVSDVDVALRELPWRTEYMIGIWGVFTAIGLCANILGALYFGLLLIEVVVGQVFVLLLPALISARFNVEMRLAEGKHQEIMADIRAGVAREAAAQVARDAQAANDQMIAAAAAIEDKKNDAENAAYLDIAAEFSGRHHYPEALEIAFSVIGGGSAWSLPAAVDLEVVELTQEMITAHSRDFNGGRVTHIWPGLTAVVLDASRIKACKIVSGALVPHEKDDDLSWQMVRSASRNAGLSILASRRDTLAPYIAAMRIKRAMKQRIDAVQESASAVVDVVDVAAVAPVGRRRLMSI